MDGWGPGHAHFSVRYTIICNSRYSTKQLACLGACAELTRAFARVDLDTSLAPLGVFAVLLDISRECSSAGAPMD